MLLAGVGFMLAFGPLNMAATDGVADHEQGLASGLLFTSLQFGGAVGLAVATAAMRRRHQRLGGRSPARPPRTLDGFHAALMVSVAVALGGRS